MNVFDEIKQKVSLEKEIEDHGGELIPTGGGRYKTVCVFHDDHNPSMVVYGADSGAEIENFHCYSCKKSGTVLDYVMRVENCEIGGAVKYFAKKYSLQTIKGFDPSDLEVEAKKKEDKWLVQVDMMRISDHVRSFLRTSRNTRNDLHRIKTHLRNLDNAWYERNPSTVAVFKHLMKDVLKSLRESDPNTKVIRDVEQCKECKERSSSKHMSGFGNVDSGLFLVTEMPDIEDVKRGEPFSGKVGKYLRECLHDQGYETTDYWLTYCLPFFVKDRDTEEGKSFVRQVMKRHLMKQIEIGVPQTIVLLGNGPKNMFFPDMESIGLAKIAGKAHEVELCGKKVKIVFNYSPYYIVENGHQRSSISKVFQRALRSAK